MNFMKKIIDKARSNIKTIVLPESDDIRVIKAAGIALKQDIAKIVLLGNRDKIYERANEIDISKADIIDPLDFSRFNEYVNTLYELRQRKGMTLEKAKKLLRDPIHFGVMMVNLGDADGMVAGSISSTTNVLRPALQILKTSPETKIVSSFFIMVVPNCEYGYDGIFIFSDCGLVEDPDAEQLSEIAISSAKTFRTLVGGEPIVAMLSYSSYGSANSPLTEKIVRATEIVRKKNPEFIVDGELQFDAAIIPSVCELKVPGCKIKGRANVLIFPDLNSGNIAYKITQRLAKAEAYGPITQGISKPVNDLSRGCSPEDIVGVIAITSIQSGLGIVKK